MLAPVLARLTVAMDDPARPVVPAVDVVEEELEPLPPQPITKAMAIIAAVPVNHFIFRFTINPRCAERCISFPTSLL